MLSKSAQKLIRSLELKKFRQETGLFIAEGTKLTTDLLELLECRLLVATEKWIENNRTLCSKANEVVVEDIELIIKISLQKNPQGVIAVFKIPEYHIDQINPSEKLTLALDSIQDPGNLGTIVRIADWFGIDTIICSRETADAFNPKSVQASMGAIGRVKVIYTDLVTFFSENKSPVYGTFLEGDTINNCELGSYGIILMGNEGKGISDNLKPFVNRKIFIPDFPLGKTGSESLNVATATAIVCYEFRRRMY